MDWLPSTASFTLWEAARSSLDDYLASGEVYDPSTNVWTAIASMSTERADFGLAALDNKLYAVGGPLLASGEVYDPSANTWTAIASMSTARYGVGLAALDNMLYAVG